MDKKMFYAKKCEGLSGKPCDDGIFEGGLVCPTCKGVGYDISPERDIKRSKTYEKAKHELDILLKSATKDNRPIVEPFVNEILELVDAFGKSGQSGGSAPFTAAAIIEVVEKCLMHKPLCPITGIADEWVDVSAMTDGQILFQNNRLSSIFKDLKSPYYLNAIVFVLPLGKGAGKNKFTGSGVKLQSGSVVNSHQFIASFPFKPKTFYIDVKEIGGEYYVKDEKQLEAVWKYYKKQSVIITN